MKMMKYIISFFTILPIIAYAVSEFIIREESLKETVNTYNEFYIVIFIATYIIIFGNKIANNNEILKILHKNTPIIYRYKDGHLLLKELYKRLENNRSKISAIYSTTVQAKIEALDTYDSYSNKVFNIFKTLEHKPNMYFFFQIPPNINLNKNKHYLEYFYNISIGPLIDNKSKLFNFYKSHSDVIEFYFNKKALTFPFINFTLIEYKEENKFEIFYGWYAAQSPTNIENSFPEVFINTTHDDICATYASLWKLLVSIAEKDNNLLIKYLKSKPKDFYLNRIKELENETG